MMTTEQPGAQPLTRKQLRELRNTGGTDTVTSAQMAAYQSELAAAAPAASPASGISTPAAPASSALAQSAPAAQAPVRIAVTSAVPAEVTPISSAPAGSPPLTRRQVRDRSIAAPTEIAPPQGDPAEMDRSQPATERDVIVQPAATTVSGAGTVSPRLGASLLEGPSATSGPLPSFEQLLTRSRSGSSTQANALIVPQASDQHFMAPVAETGDVLVTGSFNLPDRLGSTGHAPGTTDGRDIDAALEDGELPEHSSPTPIAASAAISTVKTTGDVIAPPVPERGSRLLITLAITAGVLTIALASVIILALTNGVLQ